jgi:hypothetical protein
MDKEFIRRLKEALEEIEPQLDAQNSAPRTATFGVGDNAPTEPRKYLSTADALALRGSLGKLHSAELWAMFGSQAGKRDAGVPVDVWMSAGGRSVYDAMAANPQIAHALDSSGASALIRQDLEPLLYELYIREFPAWARFRKEPANGLIHAWNQQTGFGDAKFMTELGTVTDDRGTYERKSAPIAILATRRGVSIKGQWGTLAGGAGFNPEQLEMQAGLRAIAHKMQKTIFQGNATVSSGTAADEDGEYDANAFTGLRQILNTGRAEDVDPTAGTPEDMRLAFNNAAITTMQAAGSPRVIYIDPIAKGQFDVQQDANVRYNLPLQEVAPGVMTNGVNTVLGTLPLFTVPGDSIGEYSYGGDTVSDAYLIDESAVTIPYLGSEGPTVLDIPPGISGQLTHLFIVFGMWSLAVKAETFSNKVRIVRPT